MDEGKATRPAPKWWSRPRRALGRQMTREPADAETGPPAEPATQAEPASAQPSPGAAGPGAVTLAAGQGDAEATGTGDAGAARTGDATDPADGPNPATEQVPAARPQPLHGEDPYRTPPYGGPGPWAPAPPVQLPGATPPQGVHLPPVTTTPPYGVATGPGADPWARGSALQGPQPHPAVPEQQASRSASPTTPLAPTTPTASLDPVPVPATSIDPVPAVVSAPVPVPAPITVPAPAPAPGGRKRAGRSRAVVGGVVLALVAGGAGGLIGAYVERSGSVGDVKLPQAPAERAGDGGDRPKGSIAGIARQTLPGVVTLHARGGGAEATGTGFVLDSRGHILTNNHVVESARGSDSIQVTFNSGQTAKGEVVGKDGGYDLAVVKVSDVSGLKPLPLGNSDSVRVGDPVVAIGAPFDLDGTVTTGIISAKQRPITAGGEEAGSEMSYVDALQTDAPINPGNSGGPLVDTRGRVIGINSAIKGAGNGSGLPEGEGGGSIGLGFAIPVNQARRVAEELINEGRATHPVIGITLDMEYGGEGARIGNPDGSGAPVTPKGPADEAGLQEGDVITRAGGRAVHSGEELIVRIRSHHPGDKLGLTVRHDGEERSVSVTLGSATG
ncbi:trypsin-like peptidase domain-containing protein [Streptomyces sp. NBC_01795]|uniref:S1C family serine protease n=1 Tax=Streptomyces sp. NBC_01795 TaxID=2975943 RepID=UPI002DDC50FD|nr:trypsin-like peptidase domain-containing protein [Streptomyces sp. NBC_01795]WSA92526.1 trypsin-like peptidase domain-containing protein [Streptomyces sp. NBC_01795]